MKRRGGGGEQELGESPKLYKVCVCAIQQSTKLMKLGYNGRIENVQKLFLRSNSSASFSSEDSKIVRRTL